MSDELNSQRSDEGDADLEVDEDLSVEELERFLVKFEELKADFEDIGRAYDIQTSNWRVQVGGDRLPLLLANEEETLRCLDNPDPNLRKLALHLAIHHHPRLRDTTLARCEQIALTDPALTVRTMALALLGVCYSKTQNCRLGSFLARIVSDQAVSLDEQAAAYRSLVMLDGNRVRFCIPEIIHGSPVIIDWDFVHEYLHPES